MHETRFVNEIFAVLKEKALGRDAKKIIVNARLSPFSHVSALTLKGSFKELIKGENFKNVSLKIRPLEIPLECKSCKRGTRINKRIFNCPFCNSSNVDIKMEKEFFVESIAIES